MRGLESVSVSTGASSLLALPSRLAVLHTVDGTCWTTMADDYGTSFTAPYTHILYTT